MAKKTILKHNPDEEVVLQVRMSESDKGKLKESADKAKVSMSYFVRFLIRLFSGDGVERLTKEGETK